jgi:hypothetical protein
MSQFELSLAARGAEDTASDGRLVPLYGPSRQLGKKRGECDPLHTAGDQSLVPFASGGSWGAARRPKMENNS